jgi:hypothetical protein
MNKNLLKHILIPGIGFGIGGMIWGFFIHQSLFTGEDFPIFSYWLPALILGAFAGLALGILYKDTKKIPRIIILEMIGFFIAFLVGVIITYPLFLWGNIFIFSSYQNWASISVLKPLTIIGDLFLVFAVVGGIIGIFNSFIFKKKILRLACYGAIGFALGSLIGPIIGNGILNLFGSLFLTYITTFFIICAFLGMFLGLGIYKSSILKAPDKKL